MNEQLHLNAWFEDKQGKRYDIPSDAVFPITIGRMISSKSFAPSFLPIMQNFFTTEVSRKHAFLWYSSEKSWEISDNNSRFGLYINGERVRENQRYPLKDKDIIRLGKYELTFYTSPKEEENLAPEIRQTIPHETPLFTQPIPNFIPSSHHSFSPPTENIFYLDSFINGQFIEIEIPVAPLRNKWIIGRHQPKSGERSGDVTRYRIALPNNPAYQTVSREHALLTRMPDGSWEIENLSRTQKTWINKIEVLSGLRCRIQPGDMLVLGKVAFKFREGALEQRYVSSDFDFYPDIESDRMKKEEKEDALSKTNEPPTKDIPHVFFYQSVNLRRLKAWGFLLENTHKNPKTFSLEKRVIRIGSHPLRCDIQMNDPGFPDLYAVLRWRGRSVQVISKYRESPVQVNHTEYRTSPPLKTGDIIRFYNSEFTITITGDPPELVSEQIKKNLRRSLIFLVMILNFIFFGLYFGTKHIKSKPDFEMQDVKDPNLVDTIGFVLEQHGLAGLPFLETLRKENTDPELVRIVESLKNLGNAYTMIYYAPEAEFKARSKDMKDSLEEHAKQIADYMSIPSMNEYNWYQDLMTHFNNRNTIAFSKQWDMLIEAIRKTNFQESQNQIEQLRDLGFPEKKLKDVESLIVQWTQISDKIKAQDLNAIIPDYRMACKDQRANEYLTQKKQLLEKDINDKIKRIKDFNTDHAKALTESINWKSDVNKIDSMLIIIQLLDSYYMGDFDNFLSKYFILSKEIKGNKFIQSLLMLINDWEELSRSDVTLEYQSYKRLSDLEKRVSETVDYKSPFQQEVNSKVVEYGKKRQEMADDMIVKIKALPDGYEKIMKCLDIREIYPEIGELDRDSAINYFSEFKKKVLEEQEIDKTDCLDEEIPNLLKMKNRYEVLKAKGIIENDYPPLRQLETLINRFIRK